MEQAIDVCEAYDGYLAFTHKPPLKKIIIKKNVLVIRDQRVSKKSNYQERTPHTPRVQTVNEVNYNYKLITSATLAHGSSTLFLKV